ncbi:MAG: hypothetical protein ACOC0R_00225 [Mariniphaga sp.]
MELRELKETWNRLSSTRELDENQIREMLQHRTGNLIDTINRNVRIGFIILLGLIVLFVLDDFILAPMLAGDKELAVEMPQWLVFMSIFSNVLIFTTFIYFVVKYYRVRKICDVACNLKETLIRIIETLRIYQRLFYLALFIFALALALQFISGIYTGMAFDMETQGIHLSDVPVGKWFLVAGIALLVLLFTVGGIYLLMRWGFRRLYGNYIDKLKHTLDELNEIES